ncbi:hypothetical protein DL766_000865 [Monosporascus sp. MC13-8B]|uniref:Uncharacterized protein n=1 Tax=Monosporascus cannonballus TaxID=155416 RepID=A0ABY0GVX0_9PEZI|nr:hypothetical protein DL762_010194 [Monosporascus cannonballus]RYP38655.1 hypothetical protein DL766_000865 [Monosporascus sp. MC13-8B]
MKDAALFRPTLPETEAMCNHSKTIFRCNHVQLSEKPVRICPVQSDYISGVGSEPCDEVRSHPLITLRQPSECGYCAEKRSALDQRLREAKALIAGVKAVLKGSYGMVVDGVVEVDVGATTEEAPAREAEEERDIVPELDPVQEFLRKKLAAKDAHLMMLGNQT